MGLLLAKSLGVAAVVFGILYAAQRSQSTWAAAATTIPVGTLIGFLAFAHSGPEAAERFARAAVLALPVWVAFSLSLYGALRLSGDWRVAAAVGLMVWLGAALAYVRLMG